MKAWPLIHGMPAAGHMTSAGIWHPGDYRFCTKGTCGHA